MLQLAKDFDGLTQFDLMLAMHIARCPDTGAYMAGSNGRRKAGRPRRYWARRGETLVRFTARTDEEALEKANERLFPEIIQGQDPAPAERASCPGRRVPMLTPSPRPPTPARPGPKPMPAGERRSHPVLISLTKERYERLLVIAGHPRNKSRVVAEALALLDSIPAGLLSELRERQALTGQTPGQQLAAAYQMVVG